MGSLKEAEKGWGVLSKTGMQFVNRQVLVPLATKGDTDETTRIPPRVELPGDGYNSPC